MVTPLRSSVTLLPVVCKASRIWPTEALGAFSRRMAQAPATCGAAIEVPWKLAYLRPGTEEVMTDPGASSESWALELE